MSQCDKVLSLLKRGKYLTAHVASLELGIDRLAARIENLRSRGVPIRTTMVQRGKKRFAQYWLPR